MKTDIRGFPVRQGLYDPEYEKDACGVGYVVSIDGIQSNKVTFIPYPQWISWKLNMTGKPTLFYSFAICMK